MNRRRFIAISAVAAAAPRSVQATTRWRGVAFGADAEITFPEAGMNAQVNSTLLSRPVLGYVFGQDGLMVGASLEGVKYSRIVSPYNARVFDAF